MVAEVCEGVQWQQRCVKGYRGCKGVQRGTVVAKVSGVVQWWQRCVKGHSGGKNLQWVQYW